MKLERVRKRELRDVLENSLLMVLADHQEYIPSEKLDALSKADMIRIIKWAGVMMDEASDNDVRARHAPKCLRDLLFKDHYLQRWRMPKKGPT